MDIFNSWIVNKYIAHRGFHDATHPENSLSAFQNAIDHDYAIELDVQQIEDKTPVVFHDDTLKRMTGKDGYVKRIKSVEDLKNFNLSNTTETIPTLKQVLELVDGKVPILIEIKNLEFNGEFEKAVFDVIKDYKGEFAIQSFNPFSLKWFKLNAPQILRGQLSCYFKKDKMNIFKKHLLKSMYFNKKVSEPHFISYLWEQVPNRYVNKYKNLPLLVWAVSNQQDYMKVAKHCDNIIFEGFMPRI